MLSAIEQGLQAVGILQSWSQTGNVNSAFPRGLFSGSLTTLAGPHRHLRRGYIFLRQEVKVETSQGNTYFFFFFSVTPAGKS